MPYGVNKFNISNPIIMALHVFVLLGHLQRLKVKGTCFIADVDLSIVISYAAINHKTG
jgi:hypothetical protein